MAMIKMEKLHTCFIGTYYGTADGMKKELTETLDCLELVVLKSAGHLKALVGIRAFGEDTFLRIYISNSQSKSIVRSHQ